MVAWLIWLGTSIFGDNEFGVRISAFVCGLLTMGYSYALACNLYNRSTGMRTVLLLSVAVQLFHGHVNDSRCTIDCCLGRHTLLHGAGTHSRARRCVAGMGIAFGLGLLSKYTLGLLGIAALLFVILDPIARRWMRRPHPYLAAALALLILPRLLSGMQSMTGPHSCFSRGG